MDIVCICCGEPWDIYHVLHGEPEEFERDGCRITACPCCHGVQPKDLTEAQRQYLQRVNLVAELSGDDLDGFAAMLEDFDFVGLL